MASEIKVEEILLKINNQKYLLNKKHAGDTWAFSNLTDHRGHQNSSVSLFIQSKNM